jgi:hypothetical protein
MTPQTSHLHISQMALNVMYMLIIPIFIHLSWSFFLKFQNFIYSFQLHLVIWCLIIIWAYLESIFLLDKTLSSCCLPNLSKLRLHSFWLSNQMPASLSDFLYLIFHQSLLASLPNVSRIWSLDWTILLATALIPSTIISDLDSVNTFWLISLSSLYPLILT